MLGSPDIQVRAESMQPVHTVLVPLHPTTEDQVDTVQRAADGQLHVAGVQATSLRAAVQKAVLAVTEGYSVVAELEWAMSYRGVLLV